MATRAVLKRITWLLLLQYGEMPVYIAARDGFPEVVGQLLGAGADVDAANKVRPAKICNVWRRSCIRRRSCINASSLHP
jgi:hypothetical protein